MSIPARKLKQVDTLAFALAYARHGWSVFPLHTPDSQGRCSCHKANCSNIGKHPRTMNGLNDATTDEASINKWWRQWPKANVGVVTGTGSFVTLDVDPKHGGDEALAELLRRQGAFDETLTARTGSGGRHINFAHPGVKVKNVQASKKLGAGLDVRGDGGYIVAPPSLHASGQRYEWLNDAPLAPMPAWLLDMLTSADSTKHTKKPTATGNVHQIVVIIPEGKRNNTLASQAGKMRRDGMTEDEIFAGLSIMNAQRCEPPLPDDDVRSIVRSISRYEPAHTSDAGQESPHGDKQAALTYLRRTLKLPIQEVVKRGVNKSEYEFVLEGGLTILVGDIDCLTSPRRARNAIADSSAKVLLPKFKGDDWDNVVRAVLDAAEVVETITAEGETLAWLSGSHYSLIGERVNMSDRREVFMAIQNTKERFGFVDTEGRWYVRLPALMRSIVLQAGRTTQKDLTARLTRLKFVSIEKGARDPDDDGTLVKARYWISPPNFDPD